MQMNAQGWETPPTAQDPPHADAYTRLRAETEPGLRRFIRHLLGVYGDDLAVDDLAQESYIALYQRLQAPDSPVTLDAAKPYLFGIARNLCYAELRRAKRYGLALESDHDQVESLQGLGYAVAVDPAAPPEDAAYWLLLDVEVRAAIDRLPLPQKQVLILYCEEEMSYEEIASVVGVNIGTVKSRLHYAKRSLRGMLSAATLEAIERELGE